MKNNRLKLPLVAFGLFFAFMGTSLSLNAQTGQPNGDYLCKWDRLIENCMMSAPDGYCAYGGDDCTTTVPTVEG